MKTEKNELPTRDVVKQWIDRDLNASIAFLNVIKSTPGLMEKITNEIYEQALSADSARKQMEESILKQKEDVG